MEMRPSSAARRKSRPIGETDRRISSAEVGKRRSASAGESGTHREGATRATGCGIRTCSISLVCQHQRSYASARRTPQLPEPLAFELGNEETLIDL